MSDTGKKTPPARSASATGERLRRFIERIERLEKEGTSAAGAVRQVYAEAKGAGYDTGVIREIIRLRRDLVAALGMAELLDSYKRASGMR